MSRVLTELLDELHHGRLRVVDLTQPLSPQTPLLPLPSQWNNTPAFKIWELSRYDERGPAWYWNGFETGVTQILSEGTLTGEYKYSGHWIGRLEYRHDSSNRMFFNRGAQPARSTEMTTATLGIMYVFGPTAGKPEGF